MTRRSWNRRDFSRMALGLGAWSAAAAPTWAAKAAGRDYRFERTISREVLEHYLARAITVQDLFAGQGDLADNLRMLRDLGAKFLGRSLCFWGQESRLIARLEQARRTIPKAHQVDPDMVVQACIFEIVTRQVDQVPIPAWAFEALGLPAEARNFRFADMAFADGKFRDQWGRGTTVPDVSRPETQLWFHFLAASYIDIGVEALHYGQVELMNRNDRDLTHYAKVFERARAHAAEKARRGMVLCDAHVPGGGLVREGKLLLDFHSFPLRIKEVPERRMEGILEIGFSDGLYGRSRGGTTHSGWSCDHLPYLVELDNWGGSKKPGEPGQGGVWVWGYDEIGWFAHQPDDQRGDWLRYAWRWVREHDPAAFLQMPGSRVLHTPVGDKHWYYANTPSAAVPDGFGEEAAIKAIWAADAAG
ncbi:hypothetical protein [Paludisphaera mucosa]|uniref:Uncharacterized protein n=1 Tax=Paludisphaera mucosa TaxID=3030827 RepID=A0ABT6F573_9BACT|nr:hypothetical protein [Paludisphaera mucosa]MDG3002731.1 hypothetical protein [Paludisphaera mucosa]